MRLFLKFLAKDPKWSFPKHWQLIRSWEMCWRRILVKIKSAGTEELEMKDWNSSQLFKLLRSLLALIYCLTGLAGSSNIIPAAVSCTCVLNRAAEVRSWISFHKTVTSQSIHQASLHVFTNNESLYPGINILGWTRRCGHITVTENHQVWAKHLSASK